MKTPSDWEPIPITRAEFRDLTVGSGLSGGALAGLVEFALERFGQIGPAVLYSTAFVGLVLCLFLPLKLLQRSGGADLRFGGFLGACGAGGGRRRLVDALPSVDRRNPCSDSPI